MKKALAVIIILASARISAQDDIRLGVTLDPLVGWFSPKSTNIEKDGGRPGINGGLVFEKYFGVNYALATGLTITTLGGNLLYKDSVVVTAGQGDDIMLTPGTTVAFNLSYLTIPLALKLKTNEIGYFSYFAELGILPRFNVSSKASSIGRKLSKDFIPKEINLLNLCYMFGGGVEYGIGGETSLTAGIFYSNSFTDVLSNNHYRANNNALSLRLGILF